MNIKDTHISRQFENGRWSSRFFFYLGRDRSGNRCLKGRVRWRGLHDNESAHITLSLAKVVKGQLVCDQVQDATLASAEILGKDHVVLSRVASEHQETVIECQGLAVVEIQLGHGH